MLTRRQVLSTAIVGSAASAAGASTAQAFTEVPMPPAIAAQYALGCSVAASAGNHGDLIAKARAALQSAIAGGLQPAGAEEIISCPLCGCRMVVTASN